MAWNMQIHHINIGHGDSTVIIVRDGTTVKHKVLIDAGTDGNRLVTYLMTYLKDKRVEGDKRVNRTLYFDHIIVTHYHDDHLKGFAALSSYVNPTGTDKLAIGCGTIIDLGGYALPRTSVVSSRVSVRFDSKNGTGQSYNTQDMVTYFNLMGDLYNAGATYAPIAWTSKTLSDLSTARPVVLQLDPASGITLTCYCADGILASGRNVLREDQRTLVLTNDKFDPNDTSLVFLLEWPARDFRYLASGDMSANYFRVQGEKDRTLPGSTEGYTSHDTYRGYKVGSAYLDQATPLYDYLSQDGMPLAGGKKLDVLKVPHHGSQHNMYYALLEKYGPRVLVVTANTKRSLPDAIFLREAKHYCTDNTADLFFVNNLIYSPSKRPRYNWATQLQEIAATAGYTTNITYTDSQGLALNAAAVIVNIADDSSYLVATTDTEQAVFIPDTTTPKYQIIIKKQVAGAEFTTLPSKQEENLRIVSFWVTVNQYGGGHFHNNDSGYLLREIILAGIEQQVVAEFKRWMEKDASSGSTEGATYIQEKYPSLAVSNTPANETTRRDTAWRIFNTAFDINNKDSVKVSNTTVEGYLFTPPDDKKDYTTLFNCLNNKYQLLYLYMSLAPNWSDGNAGALSNAIAKNPTKEPYWEWAGRATDLRARNATIWSAHLAPPTPPSTTGKRKGTKVVDYSETNKKKKQRN